MLFGNYTGEKYTYRRIKKNKFIADLRSSGLHLG